MILFLIIMYDYCLNAELVALGGDSITGRESTAVSIYTAVFLHTVANSAITLRSTIASSIITGNLVHL